MQDDNPFSPAMQAIRRKIEELEDTYRKLEEMAAAFGAMAPVTTEGVVQAPSGLLGATLNVFENLKRHVKPGEFHGLSNPEAAKAILQKTNQHPLTTRQIVEVMKMSGRADVPQTTVYSGLLRNPDFARVAKDTWGLAEWYKSRSKRGQARREESGEREATEPQVNGTETPQGGSQ